MVPYLEKILSLNELRVFRAVYEAGPVSRIKIANGLNLTRAAISVITKRLIELDLIIEVGKGMSRKRQGRREVLLVVNPDAGFILSVQIAHNFVAFGLVNLNGKVITKETQPFSLGSSPFDVLGFLSEALLKMLETHQIDHKRIFGMGVALPGIVNYSRGSLNENSLKGWQGFDVGTFLERQLNIKVLLENDVKMLTLGEFQYGSGRHVNDLVCLWLGDGIGAGIIHDGRLIRGITASAGEIGFNEFILELPEKNSILIEGQPKYWSDILCFTNIRASIRRGVKEGWKTNLTELAEIPDFIHAVETGDPLGLYIFRLLSRILSVVCCNLIYFINPQMFLLGGPLFNQLPRLVSEIRTHLRKKILRSPIENVEVKTSILGENGVLIGGAALVLEDLFKDLVHKSMNSNYRNSAPR